MSRTIELIDTSMRDGNQSLWGATGLTMSDVLAIAPTVDEVGYHALDFTSSTHLAVTVRYHREDPWRKLRETAAAMPRTPLTFLTTGTRFISWRPAADDVLELAFRTVVRNGVRRFQIMHPGNDMAELAQLARMARRAGAEEVVLALTYSVSPVHDDAYYARKVAACAEIAEADRFYLKDPGGLLVPDRAAAIVQQFCAAAGERPVEVHSHCTTSLAPLVYLAAAEAGAAALHTAVGPLALGTSQPSAAMTLRNLAAAGFRHDVNTDALERTDAYFRELARVKDLPPGVMPEYDAAYYRHQLPGGMATTVRRQLTEMRRPELFGAALAEIETVRADLGFPIMVTPLSQFVVTQAVMNVLQGERYDTIPDEVVRFLLGQFGEPEGTPDPDLVDRVLALPRARELRDVEPIALEGARERFGATTPDEEVLLRLTMPGEQVEAMLAARSDPPAAAAVRPGRSPVVRLLQELDRRPEISSLHLEKDGEVVDWRREPADAAG